MKKILVLALFTTLILATGCKDFLVEDPLLTQSTELTLSTYSGLNKAVGGAYTPLGDGTWYGAFLVLDSEMRVGNAMIPTNSDFASGRMTVPYTMAYNESSTSGLWSYAYFTISACNNVLNAIDNNAEALAVDGITQDDVNNLKAEALALRALSHFDLLRVYSRTDLTHNPELGISLILEPQTPDLMPSRNSVSDVYTQVITDLTTAESLMSDGYERDGVSDVKATFTKPAIQALLARVYLYAKQYQNAANYATKIISSGDYKLWSKAEYASVWGNDIGGSEVIFEVYGKKANNYDEYWEGPSHMTNPDGYADCAASFQLTDLFEEGDVRGTQGLRNADKGKVMFATDDDEKSGGQLWTMKYCGKGEGDAKSTPDVNNTIILRLSEMYLIRAEAIVNGATISGVTALSDLNTIRTARGASAITSAGMGAVMTERRLELNFEGQYWFDLARTGGTVTYSDASVTRSLAADSKFWALPIPKSQTDINENLVQNPGY